MQTEGKKTPRPLTEATAADFIIQVKELTHRFTDGAMGVDGVSLNIRRGEFVVLAGPNGSGKTTFLRHLNGLMKPSAGVVMLNDRPVSRDLREARRVVGMVFQDADSQIVGETVWEDTAFGPENLSFSTSKLEQEVSRALEATGLSELVHKPSHLLSGGEKRRLAIAGVLSMNPEVVVFDEPFSNLDHPGSCQVLQQMVRLHREGRTLIVATHDLERVIGHADRLIIMQNGRVVRDGTPADIAGEVEKFGIRVPCALRFGLEHELWRS